MQGSVRFSIAAKLALVFGLLALLILAIVVGAITQFQSIAAAGGSVVREIEQRVALVEKAQNASHVGAENLLALFITEPKEARYPLYKAIDASSAELDLALQELTNNAHDPEERQALAAIGDARKRFAQSMTDTVEDVEGDARSARTRMLGQTMPLMRSMLAAVDVLTQQQRRLAALHLEEIQAAQFRAQIVITVLSVLAIGLGGLCGWLIVRSLVIRLRIAVRTADEIAGGSLRQSPEPAGNDEVTMLDHALAQMLEQLRGMILSIRDGAIAGDQAALALKGAAEQVAAGSVNQERSTQDISQSIGHFAATIPGILQTAEYARTHARQAVTLASSGRQKILGAAHEITEIARVVVASSTRVHALNQRSTEVADTVMVIREIAEQTNLLSLNAAIEAARAGEQGRGFAVVADEIRRLATRTAKATSEIATVLDGMKCEALEASNQMAAGSETIQVAVGMIEALVAPLTALEEAATASLDNLAGLAQATATQLSESERIVTSVDLIATAAAANRDNADAVLTSVTSVTDAGLALQRSVERFRIH
jgi:methyl-accepting chemotaxis protein